MAFLRNCRKVYCFAFTLTPLECFGGGLGWRQSGKLNSSVKFSLKFKVRDSAGGLPKFSSVSQLPISLSVLRSLSLSLSLSPSLSLSLSVSSGNKAIQQYATLGRRFCTSNTHHLFPEHVHRHKRTTARKCIQMCRMTHTHSHTHTLTHKLPKIHWLLSKSYTCLEVCLSARRETHIAPLTKPEACGWGKSL